MSTNDRHRPRILTAPPNWDQESLHGAHLAEISEIGGRPLDTWQHFALEVGSRLAPRHLGSFGRLDWTASEVGVVAGRQNGLSTLALARALGGAFLRGEKVVYTTDRRLKARDAMHRAAATIASAQALEGGVDKTYWTLGEERILLHNGGSIHFLARTARSVGAAYNADLLVIDDATAITDFWWINAVGIRPDTWLNSTRQVWYLGTAVNRRWHPRGQVFSSIRHRGLSGMDPHLCWLEYSAPDTRHPDGTLRIDPTSRRATAAANPSPRMTDEKIRHFRLCLSADLYNTDFLGIGDWYEPATT